MIAFNVRTVLSAYFQPNEPEEIRAAQLAWWADELADWHLEQVVWALRSWNRDNPRLRPTPGDIVSMLKLARGKKLASERRHEETPQERYSPAEREAMRKRMAEAADEVLGKMRSKVEGEQ